jgi:hypothetical protein
METIGVAFDVSLRKQTPVFIMGLNKPLPELLSRNEKLGAIVGEIEPCPDKNPNILQLDDS